MPPKKYEFFSRMEAQKDRIQKLINNKLKNNPEYSRKFEKSYLFPRKNNFPKNLKNALKNI